MKHYECPSITGLSKPLIFDWDEETGTITGPGAPRILEMAKWGGAKYGPHPGLSWEFSAEPLKSKTDMAVIIGRNNRIPEDLAPYYPRYKDPYADWPYEDEWDENGNLMKLGKKHMMN
ncbi:MAG: hypothetical protein ACR2HF_09095 [Methylococcaceae bacterium]